MALCGVVPPPPFRMIWEREPESSRELMKCERRISVRKGLALEVLMLCFLLMPALLELFTRLLYSQGRGTS